MTPEELIALVEILNRCPKTLAEKLFVQELVNRLEVLITPPNTERMKQDPG